MIDRLHHALGWLLERAVGLLALVMLVLALAQVGLRYLFAAPLLWVEEVSVMALIWAAWLGAVLLWLRAGHIAVDLVPKLLGPGAERALAHLMDLAAMVGGVALVWVNAQTITVFGGMEMGSLEITASLKYYPITAGGAGLALAAALNMARRWRGRPGAGGGAP
ncbi:MAG: TRAP transporter small permease subunit [Hyphomicrobiales bacterium]|nr:TRAP transporter small permease subunit [Hyphomicrobiales bacterium]